MNQNVVGNDNSLLQQACTHLAVVEDRGGDARVGLARVTAAGTAIETRRVGVVDRGRAVTSKQDEPRKATCHRHGFEHRFRHGESLLGVKAGCAPADLARRKARTDAFQHAAIETIEIGMRRRTGEAEAVGDDLRA